jgi:hypothetical protein
MMSRPIRLLAVVLAVSLALATGCKYNTSKSPETAKMNPQFSVAVAPFSVAHESYELLTGYMQEKLTPPKADAVMDLDAIMTESLHVTPESNIIPPAKVKDCLDGTRRPGEASRQAILKFWQTVGQCQDAKFILVPVVSHWKEREGSPAGSTSPAWVILDLYLVNVKTGQLANHFHYDYQQQALTDNFLEVDKFLKRHGQWVRAEDLAREGIVKGLKELGLQ